MRLGVARFAVIGSTCVVVSCAAILGLPDPTLDETIPVGGGSSSGAGSSSGTNGDGSPNDDGSSGSDGSIDAPFPDGGPPAEGKPISSQVLTSGSSNTYVACDGSGNVYLATQFNGTRRFGAQQLTSTGNDVAVVKLAANGTVLWASQIGGANDEDVRSITADSKGDVYVSGTFDSQTLDAAGSTAQKGTAPVRHAYIAKLNGGTGNGVWASGFTLELGDNTVNVECRAVRATSVGIAFACPFRGTLDFPTSSRALTDRYGALVGKIDATSGAVTSSAVISSTVSSGTVISNEAVEVIAVDLDAQGDLVVAGATRATAIRVGATTAANSGRKGTISSFVMKVKSDLSAALWASVYGPAGGASGSSSLTGMRVDRTSGSVYLGGTFSENMDFGLGNQMIDAANSPAIFVARLDDMGKTLWEKTINAQGSGEKLANVDVDPWGRPFFAGYLSSPPNGAFMIDGKPVPAGNVFLAAKLAPADGKALYVSTFTGGNGTVYDVAGCPTSGHAIVAGAMNGTVTFETARTSSAFGNDLFVVDLTP